MLKQGIALYGAMTDTYPERKKRAEKNSVEKLFAP
jgi:hypothetical protein